MMVWIGAGVVVIVGVAVLAVILAKGRVDDLGSVSTHWIEQHRVDLR
jgi:hypothetical protein